MSAEETYRQTLSSLQTQLAEKQGQNAWIPWVRATTLISAVVLSILGFSGDLFAGWGWLVGALFAGFTVAVGLHRNVQRAIEDIELLIKVNERSLQRLDGKWLDFPEQGKRYEDDLHPYAQDIDILGHNSLFQLLNTTTTRLGEDTLAQWLLHPATHEEITQRQQYVQDLVTRTSLRQDLEREGTRIGKDAIDQDPEKFLKWAESQPLLATKPLLLWVMRLMPVWTTFWLLAYIVNTKLSILLWAIPLMIQFLIFMKTSSTVIPLLMDATSRQRSFALYSALFHRIELEEETKNTPFETLQGHFRTDDGWEPYKVMKRFQFLIDLVDVRHTPLMHLPLNMLLLWDLQCLRGLEQVKSSIGPHVRGWFAQLGEIEALCSFATFSYENPGYSFPTFAKDDAPLCYTAKALGHPLLHRASRVCNDFSLDKSGPMMLITGSNMSGKSTFLRSIGVNAVLAYSGSVVCAEDIHLSRMQIGSSMRIKDSLEHGISYFMAELHRIRRVVELGREGEPLLYLLDEILHGTNTVERRTAALGIMTLLNQGRTIGIVTTHDLELAEESEAFGEQVQFRHFTDQIEDDEMTFDYTLREGICPSTNALRLMNIVGIPLPEWPPRQAGEETSP